MKLKKIIHNTNFKLRLSLCLIISFCVVNKSYAIKKDKSRLAIAFNQPSIIEVSEKNNKSYDNKYINLNDTNSCFLNHIFAPDLKKSFGLENYTISSNKRFILALYNSCKTNTNTLPLIHQSLLFNIPVTIYVASTINSKKDSKLEITSDVYSTYYINKSPNSKILLLGDDLALRYDLGIGDARYVLSFTPFKLGISYKF